MHDNKAENASSSCCINAITLCDMNTDDMSLVTLIVRHDFLFNKKALTVYLKDNKRLICMYG